MLAISQPSSRPVPKTTPNLLPCAIKHTGPIPTPKRYWDPESKNDDDSEPLEHEHSTAYFRGRKLRGRTVKLPEGYQGLMLEKTEKDLSVAPRAAKRQKLVALSSEYDGDDDENGLDEEEESVDVKLMEFKGTFDKIVVWGREVVPDEDDIYVKGVEEWMKIAEAMNFDRGQIRD